MRGLLALVPAHNEAGGIGATLRSLAAQTRPPDRIVVVADNCTDDTAAIARAHGAEVIETLGNTGKKAGALNQALHAMLEQADAFLVMDADSTMSADFLSTAEELLDGDPGLGAVGGVFYGEDRPGLLARMQANEYARYGRDIARHRGRVMVLTGTASLIRASALAQVRAERGGRLPGVPGQVYDAGAITEDNELTLALKTLGWRLVSPAAECRVTTELMPTWRDLWKQRLRWQRGAIDNVRSYGVTRVTARYWGQQVGMAVGVVLMSLYLLVTVVGIALMGLQLRWLWVAIGVIFVAERIATVWPLGWRARGVAVLMLPELGYDLFLMGVFVRSLADVMRRRETGWHHVVAERG